MLVITNRDLNSPHVQSALGKIENCGEFSGKYSFRVARFCSAVRQEMKKTQETYLELLKKYCVLDEKGHAKLLPDGAGFEFVDGGKEKYDEAFKELMDESFEVKVHKVPLSEIEKAKLSPNELLVLEPLIDVPEDDEDTQSSASK